MSSRTKLILFLLTLLTLSCSSSGSNTQPEDSTPITYPGDTPVVSEESQNFSCAFCYAEDSTTKSEVGIVLVGLCARLNQCDPNTSLNPCLYYANADTALIAATGADTSTISTFETLQTAVDKSSINQSLQDYADCNNSMPSISCSSFTEASVFDSGTGVYSNFGVVVTPACTNIFTNS